MNVRALWILSLLLAVEGFTLDDELKALRRSPKDYAALHGMRLDVIQVETSDGWLLNVHRIRSMAVFDEAHSPPVVLSHGIACSSMEFMVNFRNESLAFLLADRGYDVWAINHRATRFSDRVRRHGKVVKPSTNDYIRATWQYMAERDMPAVMDKVLKVTHQSKVYLAGQSMGGTILFAFLSENHNYDNNIPLFSTICPVILFGRDTFLPLKLVSAIFPLVIKAAVGPLFPLLMNIRILASSHEPINEIIQLVTGEFCRFSPNVCALVTDLLFQRNPVRALLKKDEHIRASRMPIYYTKFPSGAPTAVGYLFTYQMFKDTWKKMDYDILWRSGITNEQEYNQKEPPAYDFSNFSVPAQAIFTTDDIFMGTKTIKKLIEKYGLTSSEYSIVDEPNFTHQDSNWGWDARCFFYDKITNAFDRLELERAGVTPNGKRLSKSTKVDKGRANYRLKTVPKFIESLGLPRNCPD